MRFHRVVYLFGWLAVTLLAIGGFAAFSTTVETRGDELRPGWGKASGAVAAQTWSAMHPTGATLVFQFEDPAVGSLVAGAPTTSAPAAAAPQVSAKGEGWLSSVEVRRLVTLYFQAEDVNRAVRVAWCASRFDPTWVDPTDRGAGLFQHSEHEWSEQASLAGLTGASMFDPEASTAVAAWVVYNGGGWEALACEG